MFVEINLCLFENNKTRKNHQHLYVIKQLWWYPWLYVQNKTKIKCFVEYRNIAQLYKKNIKLYIYIYTYTKPSTNSTTKSEII